MFLEVFTRDVSTPLTMRCKVNTDEDIEKVKQAVELLKSVSSLENIEVMVYTTADIQVDDKFSMSNLEKLMKKLNLTKEGE